LFLNGFAPRDRVYCIIRFALLSISSAHFPVAIFAASFRCKLVKTTEFFIYSAHLQLKVPQPVQQQTRWKKQPVS
jgi:hypothetical protein